MASGATAPRASLLSQLASSVVPGTARRGGEAGAIGAGAFGRGMAVREGVSGASSRGLGRAGSSGRTVAITRAHKASSSGLRRRILSCGDALGQEDIGALHSAGDHGRFLARAPEGIEAVGAANGAAGILGDPQAIGFRTIE